MGLTYPVMAKRQPGPALSMEAVLTNTANMPRGLAKSRVCACVYREVLVGFPYKVWGEHLTVVTGRHACPAALVL